MSFYLRNMHIDICINERHFPACIQSAMLRMNGDTTEDSSCMIKKPSVDTPLVPPSAVASVYCLQVKVDASALQVRFGSVTESSIASDKSEWSVGSSNHRLSCLVKFCCSALCD